MTAPASLPADPAPRDEIAALIGQLLDRVEAMQPAQPDLKGVVVLLLRRGKAETFGLGCTCDTCRGRMTDLIADLADAEVAPAPRH